MYHCPLYCPFNKTVRIPVKKVFILFRFPKDIFRRKIWLQNCRRDKWVPINSSELCEIHFEESQFEQLHLVLVFLCHLADAARIPSYILKFNVCCGFEF
ncbi:hypothetical protein QTP88_022152 [Uroleucon formosanum]